MAKPDSKNGVDNEEKPPDEALLDLDTLASLISKKAEQNQDDEALHSISYHLIGSIDEDRTREISTLVREAANAPNLSHIWLYITSFGGIMDYALGMYDALRCLRHPVYTVVVGAADSAATIVALAGDRRFILPKATMTVHSPCIEVGDEKDIDAEEAKDLYQRLSEGFGGLLGIYTERTNLSRAKAEKLCLENTALSAREAKKYGFVHKIVPYAKKLKRVAPSPFKK